MSHCLFLQALACVVFGAGSCTLLNTYQGRPSNYVRRSVFKILTGKPKGKKTLGSRRRRREDSIRISLKNRYLYEELDYSTQDRDYWRPLVNAALNLRVL